MSREELLQVFEWLETNMNKNKLVYFKLIDNNQIGSYFKISGQHFANFYINVILSVIKGDKDEWNKINR